MMTFLELFALYSAAAIINGGVYAFYAGGIRSKGSILAFALINPLIWTALSVITAATGIYYYILPNRDISLAIAACLATFPSAALTHAGTG